MRWVGGGWREDYGESKKNGLLFKSKMWLTFAYFLCLKSKILRHKLGECYILFVFIM